jgi:hypothetical protein
MTGARAARSVGGSVVSDGATPAARTDPIQAAHAMRIAPALIQRRVGAFCRVTMNTDLELYGTTAEQSHGQRNRGFEGSRTPPTGQGGCRRETKVSLPL